MSEAEECLLRAHATDPNYLPALEQLPHFYDAVSPDAAKARAFAAAYLEKSRKVLEELQDIVNSPDDE